MQKNVQQIAKELLPGITAVQLKLFRQYAELIRTENQRMNLVSRNDEQRLWENHILPCIICLKFVRFLPDVLLLDFGSGAGFPGVPLKIAEPQIRLSLLDSRRKIIIFLKKTILELGLKNAESLLLRLDEKNQPTELTEKYDVVTARAVSSLEKLFRNTAYLLKPNGYFLFWKGVADLEELNTLGLAGREGVAVHRARDILEGISPHLDNLVIIRIPKKALPGL